MGSESTKSYVTLLIHFQLTRDHHTSASFECEISPVRSTVQPHFQEWHMTYNLYEKLKHKMQNDIGIENMFAAALSNMEAFSSENIIPLHEFCQSSSIKYHFQYISQRFLTKVSVSELISYFIN